MSALSDYLNAHLPAGWTKRDLIAALAADLDRTTVYRYLAGNHSQAPPEYVLQAFARALPDASLVELRAAAGVAAGMEEPWVPPLEANRLNHGQRSALEAFIRATVQSQPEPGQFQPEGGRSQPEGGQPQREAGRSQPEGGQPQREAGTSQPEARQHAADPRTGADRQQILSYIRQLRQIGQSELADRLEDSLESTSSASETARRSSST
ncbi:MAG TPA: hypothetical protein VFU36_10615 [Jatrophihabitans sp.]|nr:hypothetical protein [Jatrophihabitans sp.]